MRPVHIYPQYKDFLVHLHLLPSPSILSLRPLDSGLLIFRPMTCVLKTRATPPFSGCNRLGVSLAWKHQPKIGSNYPFWNPGNDEFFATFARFETCGSERNEIDTHRRALLLHGFSPSRSWIGGEMCRGRRRHTQVSPWFFWYIESLRADVVVGVVI